MSTRTEKTKLNKIERNTAVLRKRYLEQKMQVEFTLTQLSIERNRSENSDATVQKMMANLYAGIEISSDLLIQAEI